MKINTDFWQTRLIPADAGKVRGAFQKAAVFSHSKSLWEAHVFSTAYAIKGVAAAFFTSFLFIARSLKCVIHLNNPAYDLLDAVRCLSIVAASVVIVALGIFFPAQIYPLLAPRPISVDLSAIKAEFPDGMLLAPIFSKAFTANNLWKVVNEKGEEIDDGEPVCFDGDHIEPLPLNATEEEKARAVCDFIALLLAEDDARGIPLAQKLAGKPVLTLKDVKESLREFQKGDTVLLKDSDLIIFDGQVSKESSKPTLKGEELRTARRKAVVGFQALLIETYGVRLAVDVIHRHGLASLEELTWGDIKLALIAVSVHARLSDLYAVLENLDDPKTMRCKDNLTAGELEELRGANSHNLTERQMRILERAFRSVKIGPVREDVSHALLTDLSASSVEAVFDLWVTEGRRATSLFPRNRFEGILTTESLKKMMDIELWSKEIAYYGDGVPEDDQTDVCANGLFYKTPYGYYKVVGRIPHGWDAVLPFFYKPIDEEGLPKDQPYPFVMTFRGTLFGDLFSLVRDFDVFGIGKTTFDARREEIKRSLFTHLESIPRLEVALRIFGHSLGAVDTQRMVQLILELLEEREQQKRDLEALGPHDHLKRAELISSLNESDPLEKIVKIETGTLNPPAPEHRVSDLVHFHLLNRLSLLLAPILEDPAQQQDLTHAERTALHKILKIDIGRPAFAYRLYGYTEPPSEWSNEAKQVLNRDTELLLSILKKKNIPGRDLLELSYVQFDNDGIQQAGDRLVGACCLDRSCEGCVMPLATRKIFKLSKDKGFDFGAHMSKGFTASSRWPEYALQIIEDGEALLDEKLCQGKYHLRSLMQGRLYKFKLWFFQTTLASIIAYIFQFIANLAAWITQPSRQEESELPAIEALSYSCLAGSAPTAKRTHNSIG